MTTWSQNGRQGKSPVAHLLAYRKAIVVPPLLIRHGWQHVSHVEVSGGCAIKADQAISGMHIEEGAEIIVDRIIGDVRI